MSEFEILQLYGSATADQTAVIGLLISLHLAMIVGIFYFLHHSGRAMKLAVVVLYTLGYLLLVGLVMNQGALIWGLSRDLVALTEDGQRLSGVGYAVLQQTHAGWWVNVVATIAMLTLWVGTVAFLFFWKRPPETMLSAG
jgi:hypothetical protein